MAKPISNKTRAEVQGLADSIKTPATKKPSRLSVVPKSVRAAKKTAKPAVKKAGRSGSVSGVAAPTVLKNPNTKKPVSAAAFAPENGPLKREDMAALHTAILVADVSFRANDYRFFEEVIIKVKEITGKTFAVSTYEGLIRSALGVEAAKRYPIGKRIEKSLGALGTPVTFGIKYDEPALANIQITADPSWLLQRMVDASNGTATTLAAFKDTDRDRLAGYILFFERFWAFIDKHIQLDKFFNAEEFYAYLDSAGYKLTVAVGEYACFKFKCGSRAVVIRSRIGSAAMFVAESDFIASLKGMVPAVEEAVIQEQVKKNPPVLSLLTCVPIGLSALVSARPQTERLQLGQLHQIFGDPFHYGLGVPQYNLVQSSNELAELFAKSSV